jgi:hypothetical protein
VTHAVRSPVRSATRRMRVVSMASGSVIANGIVMRRRVIIDLPAPWGSDEEQTRPTRLANPVA